MGKQHRPLIPMETEGAQASAVRVTSDRPMGHRGGDFLYAWRVACRGQRRGSNQSHEAAAESQREGAHV